MTRLALLTVLLLLSACGSNRPPQTALERQCRQEANNSPQVKSLLIAAIPGTTNDWLDKSVESAHDQAGFVRDQLVQDCLRRHGVATAGGVEPVKKYPFSSLGF